MQKQQKPFEKRLRINNFIRVPQVNVIDEEGVNLGTMTVGEALKLSQERGFDLVEVGPMAKPPVTKIMDYGKFMYQKEKKERENKTVKSRDQEIKIAQLGFKTGTHDMGVRANQIDKFLEKGYRIKIDLRLRGREKGMAEIARAKLNEFLTYITQPYMTESPVKQSPSGFNVLIKPDIKQQKHA